MADLRPAVRRILDHCGLDWDDACMEFHTTDRGVRTPSRWQVRQRLYASSVGRWEHYERHLQPLRELLARPSRVSRIHSSGRDPQAPDADSILAELVAHAEGERTRELASDAEARMILFLVINLFHR